MLAGMTHNNKLLTGLWLAALRMGCGKTRSLGGIVNSGLTKFIAAILVAVPSAVVQGHGGGLNAEGCHTNRKTGEYHCHRSEKAESRGAKGAIAPSQKLAAPTKQTTRSLPPGCYVGPRGGTYTITRSGRKNYSGC